MKNFNEIISQIATYCSPAECEALRSTSALLHESIPIGMADAVSASMGRAKQAEMDEKSKKTKRNKFLIDELSENSTFRILWIESHGHCKYWNAMPKNDQDEYKEFFNIKEKTPDFLYYGVPADAFSVKRPLFESRDEASVKAYLFKTLITEIEGKWKKYGTWTIAVADISTWPNYIRTHEAAQHVILKLRPTEQKVFLIRSRPNKKTKLMKIFYK